MYRRSASWIFFWKAGQGPFVDSIISFTPYRTSRSISCPLYISSPLQGLVAFNHCSRSCCHLLLQSILHYFIIYTMSFKQSKPPKVRWPSSHASSHQDTARGSHCKDEARDIVIDYLTVHGYQKSLQTFKVQSSKLKRGESSAQEKIISLLNSNSRVEFFNRLRKEVPKQVRENDETFRRLEFFLHIYFLIATRKEKSFDTAAMSAFKSLLQTKGKYLSQKKQFLPYFALPYIHDPSSHPASISHIFKNEWLTGIKTQLTAYLETISKDTHESKLQILLKKDHEKSNTASFQMHSSRQKELLQIIRQSSQHYNELQENYKEMIEAVKQNLVQSQAKWFHLSKELITITKKFIRVAEQNNLISGQMPNMVDKIKKYQVFLNSNVDEVISSSVSMSVFDQPTYEELPSQNVSRNMIHRKTSLSMLSLNYPKIKQYLLQDTELNVCLLLQALRWRITKTASAYARREIIMGYTINDILSLKVEDTPLLQRLLGLQASELVKQHSLRLINAIQSDYYGRSYMLENNSLLEKLVQTLKSESYDGTIRRLTLNALQKLSLRPQAQLYTIQQGIIHWIVQTIKLQRQELSETSFEYLTALLMNMTLKKAGQEQCQKQHMLQLLVDLLDIQYGQIRMYVCGSIYSLLSYKKSREEANRIGMLEQLKQYSNRSNNTDQFAKQLNYIIKQLEKKECGNDTISNEEEENDVDDLEQEQNDDNEEEFDDEIEGTQRMDKGEELLLKKYSCVGPQAIRQEYLARSILDDTMIKNSIEVSMIKEKKSSRGQNKSLIPVRSTLELIEAIDDKPKHMLKQNNQCQPSITIQEEKVSIPRDYDSNNYVPKYNNFRKKKVLQSIATSQQSMKPPQTAERTNK